MTLPMRLACAALRLTPTKRLYRSPRAMRNRYLQRQPPEPAPVPSALHRDCIVEESTVGGMRTVTLRPPNPSGVHIIYTHGGTYINELVRPHWWLLQQLICRTRATITVPFYPLAPERTYREAYPYLEAVYRRVLANTAADDVVLAGDSAGGGLAVGQALHFQASELPRPGKLVLFSPWLDTTGTNPQIVELDLLDPMLAAPGAVEAGSWWADGTEARDPLISPLFASDAALTKLPPVHIYQGGRDICMADSLAFERRLKAVGGHVVLNVYPDAFHVFVGLPWLPESRQALALVAQVLDVSPSASAVR